MYVLYAVLLLCFFLWFWFGCDTCVLRFCCNRVLVVIRLRCGFDTVLIRLCCAFFMIVLRSLSSVRRSCTSRCCDCVVYILFCCYDYITGMLCLCYGCIIVLLVYCFCCDCVVLYFISGFACVVLRHDLRFVSKKIRMYVVSEICNVVLGSIAVILWVKNYVCILMYNTYTIYLVKHE